MITTYRWGQTDDAGNRRESDAESEDGSTSSQSTEREARVLKVLKSLHTTTNHTRPATIPTARNTSAGSNVALTMHREKSKRMAQRRDSVTSSVDQDSYRGSSRDSSTVPASNDPPNPVDQACKFGQYAAKRPDYKNLVKLCRGRWRKIYQKRQEHDQDKNIVDYAYDKEVRERGREGVAFWDRKYAAAEGGFTIDYIVATNRRELGEEMAQYLLLKYTHYPIPSWESNCNVPNRISIAVEECRRRLHDLDLVEIRLRTEFGDEYFLRRYPNRYVKWENGAGAGGYVKNKRSIYKNMLRAIETRWKYECDRAGLPPVYIEDWTNEPEDVDGVALVKFMNYLCHSPFVQGMLPQFNQLERMKCNAGCDTCNKAKRTDEVKHCCGMRHSISINQETGQFEWVDEGIAPGHGFSTNFECTDECGCGSQCRNRYVQKGRQFPLCVFRQPDGKGWGVRVMQQIDKSKFVSEYIGEVNEVGLGGKLDIYDFDMGFHVMDATGKKLLEKKLVISAGKKGNESRFFNHSCVPNMTTMMTVIERYGMFYTHVAFFTDRKIMPGEELTFDYFPGQDGSSLRTVERMFENCKCGSAKCRFPGNKIDPLEKIEDQENDMLLVASQPVHPRGERLRFDSDSDGSTSSAASRGSKRKWRSEEEERGEKRARMESISESEEDGEA